MSSLELGHSGPTQLQTTVSLVVLEMEDSRTGALTDSRDQEMGSSSQREAERENVLKILCDSHTDPPTPQFYVILSNKSEFAISLIKVNSQSFPWGKCWRQRRDQEFWECGSEVEVRRQGVKSDGRIVRDIMTGVERMGV